MVIRGGLLLSLAAVFLQIAVFLQPLLPKQYQVAPVAETSDALSGGTKNCANAET